jgi:cell division septum initiation protein DivIVA
MTDIMREKYQRLMEEIGELEDRIDNMNKEADYAKETGADSRGLLQECADLQEELAEKRTELARISDGCGKPFNTGS